MGAQLSLLPCEVAAKSIIPSIRAAVAKLLVEEYGMPRYKAAKLLNMTPAAITNYLEGRRGARYLDRILRDERLMRYVRRLSEMLARGAEDEEEYQILVCSICSSVNPLIHDKEKHLAQVLSARNGEGRGPALRG